MPGTIPIFNSSAEPNFETAAADGMIFPNDGRTKLWIDNDGGSTRLVVTPSAVPCSYGQAAHHDDEEHQIESGKRVAIGPFPVLRFGGLMTIGYDSETGLSFAGVRVEALTG